MNLIGTEYFDGEQVEPSKMTLRDQVDKAVADRTPAELNKLLESLDLLTITRLPNDTDEQWRKRILDYHFDHKVESKRKKAIERICQAIGVETPEERAAELVERQLSAPEPTARRRLSKNLLYPILVTVIGGILLYVLIAIVEFWLK